MKRIKDKILGMSLKWDKGFIKNLIIVLLVMTAWRGGWSLIDAYFSINTLLISNILAIVIGMTLIYLPEGTLQRLANHIKENK